jgi:flagellar hook-basal body complex protein FliE
MVNSIDGMGPLMVRGAGTGDTGPVGEVKESFGKILTGMVSQVNEAQLSGDLAIERLQSGDAKHLHEVMIAVEEADVSLRMFVQLRNKALTAYEEIMRMQI